VAGATQSGKDPLVSALSRVLGIIAGVLLTLLLSTLVFPKLASDKCLAELHQALVLLDTMCATAWSGLMQAGRRRRRRRSCRP
jgi:uncharacterized membrane protein YccC